MKKRRAQEAAWLAAFFDLLRAQYPVDEQPPERIAQLIEELEAREAKSALTIGKRLHKPQER
jgi:hypothetical protein